jgi:hypothetical protein
MRIIAVILIVATACAAQTTARAARVQASPPKSAEEVFLSRPNWATLPDGFLKLLGQRLKTATLAGQFVAVCEKGKIFEERVVPLAASHKTDPENAVSMLASVLTSHAGGEISNQQYGDAKVSLKLAIQLEPDFWPAWGRLALVAFAEGDCKSATGWADKVLAATEHSNSREEKEAATALQDQSVIGSVTKVREGMLRFKKSCSRSDQVKGD